MWNEGMDSSLTRRVPRRFTSSFDDCSSRFRFMGETSFKNMLKMLQLYTEVRYSWWKAYYLFVFLFFLIVNSILIQLMFIWRLMRSTTGTIKSWEISFKAFELLALKMLVLELHFIISFFLKLMFPFKNSIYYKKRLN